ncbi:MAG TPA: WS/DGAT domain-containing protein [Gemmatimonadales bacterium]|nr:WS/DGAT domain-containing protein [Gemmatimonadales bacterium]
MATTSKDIATRSASTALAPTRVPVAPHDAIWLQDTPTNLMVINGVITTDRLDLATLRRVFQERVIDGAEGRFARFRQRVERSGGGWCWVDDPDFDIARHIFAAPSADIGTTEKLREYVGREASKPLPADRALWQFQLIEDFENGGSACLVRLHHCIGDGVSLVTVIFHLMEEVAGHEGASPARIQPAAGRFGSKLVRAIQIPFAAPAILIARLLWIPDRTVLHGPRVSGKKQVAWTEPLDLQVLKDIKNRLGATVNDVLMAAVSGALSRYIERRAGQAIVRLRISMPVSIRNPAAKITLENRFAAVPLELPAGIAQARERVARVKERMDALKKSVAPIVIYGIQSALLKVLPQAASRGLIDFLANKCTAVVTNVPGPQRGLTLGGARLRSLLFWVPQRADIGVGISILSFAGKVQIGVLCDTEVVPDPMELVRAFEEELAALRAL